MSRRVRTIGMNIAMIFMGLVVLVLGWQMLQWVRVPPAPPHQILALTDQYPAATDIYQIEIRNGAGVAGAAQALREYLMGKGYDVVEVGNHPSFDVEKTQVVDRVGNLDIARQVAASLGLAEDHVLQEERQQYFLDVSVIIGKDYLILPPFVEGVADAQEQQE